MRAFALVAVSLFAPVIAGACHSDSKNPDTDAPGSGSGDPDAAPPGPDASEGVPVFRNAVALDDGELALKSLDILGALPVSTTPGCTGCHGMTSQHIRYWRALTDTSGTACLTDLSVSSAESARQMIDCLRQDPTQPTSPYQAQKLGFFTTAAALPWFAYAFDKAYGVDGPAKLAEFQMMVQMPRGGQPALTQDQFDIVAEWFSRGAPLLEQTLPEGTAPVSCEPGVSSDVATHVATLHTTGWRALNRDAGLAMFGCGSSGNPLDCLSTMPYGSDQSYGAGWDVPGAGRMRVLFTQPSNSSYWTRSSPDGRFIAHGGGNGGSTMIDLQRNTAYGVNAAFDPGFFPDNSGFIFQGASQNTCPLSVLTANPSHVNMTEPGCSDLNVVSLYQHLGRALGGGDWYASTSQFVSDSGGHGVTMGDPEAFFGEHSSSNFIRLVQNSGTYAPHDSTSVATPYEGDTVISPSATAAITRIGDTSGTQLGYVLRKLSTAQDGTIDLPEMARYCVTGGKPAFSYDERWIVYHHYISNTNADAIALGFTGTADPGFAQYASRGAANVYLLDLLTGATKRITNMAPGQYALFPHFRSDGWIYMDIRVAGGSTEYFTASDAALLAE